MDTKTLNALAEPNRLRIIELLRQKPYSVNDFGRLLNIRQPQVSKHLQTLRLAGLVDVQTSAQQRIYSLNPDAFFRLEQWVHSFNVLWSNRLDTLDAHLKTIKKE
jgi:DNA-binding transcriptional ArsR family regulator